MGDNGVWTSRGQGERPHRRLAMASAALVLAACGSAPEKPKSLWPGGEAAPKKASTEAKGPEDDRYIVLGENPKWKPIAPLFEAYAQRSIEGIVDPMLPGLVHFVEKPIVEERVEADAPDPAKAAQATDPEAEADPRTVSALEDYRLVILVTGVAQPKAVVVDGSKHRLTLVRGDPLGKEGGRVEAILQYKMLVSVPGKAKPVEISIAPPMSELESEAGQEDSGL